MSFMLDYMDKRSSLDCVSGYYKIGLLVETQKKSTFITPVGKFGFNKVPYGIAQSSAHFQCLINKYMQLNTCSI